MKYVTLEATVLLVATFALAGLAGFGMQPISTHAQSQSIDYAIGGYDNVTGYSSYQFQWTPSQLNASNIYDGGIMLNLPLTASGTLSSNNINYNLVGIWMQDAIAITNTGNYFPVVNYWFFLKNNSGILIPHPIVESFPFISIYPNGSIYFIMLNYTTFDGVTGWWYILGSGTSTEPSSITYLTGISTTVNGEIDIIYLASPPNQYNTIFLTGSSNATLGNAGTVLKFNGAFISPSIGLEINESAYGDFTEYNPGFLVFGSFFAGNSYVANVYYANSSSSSSQEGFEAGLNPPPNTVAGGGGTYESYTGTEYSEASRTPQSISSAGLVYTQKAGTDLTELTYIQPYVKPIPAARLGSAPSLQPAIGKEINLNITTVTVPFKPPVPWYIEYMKYELGALALVAAVVILAIVLPRARHR